MKVVSFIMYYAPIGLAAYFAALVGEFGPQLLELTSEQQWYTIQRLSFTSLYSLRSMHTLQVASKVYKYFGRTWSPTVTSLATCSSAASIPANLEATKKMGISSDVRETVVLLGSTLHKDGSVLGAY